PCSLLFSCSGDHRALHSFPTRRSSDLVALVALRSLLVASQVVGERPLEGDLLRLDLPAPLEDRPCQTERLLVPRAREVVLLRQRSEEHTSELQSRENLVCRLLLEKKNK